MKINRSLVRGGRKFISVALCLVMMFTTFFIFEPSVLSELLPKASAADVVYSKVTNENGTWTSGTDYTLSGSTYTIKTGNGFAYFLKNPTTFNGKKVVLDCNVDFSGITYAYWDDSATAWYGELDGANHIVANYRQSIDKSERTNVGGFGVIRKMSGGIVKDLTIKDTYIKVLNRRDKSRTNVYGLGALIGKIEGESSAAYTDVQINNVTVDGAKIIKFGRDGRENDYGYGCGGIVGQTFKKTVFTNCKVINTKVSPNQDDNRRGNKEGGFVGESIGAEIIIKNDTPMVSVASTTFVYDKNLAKKDSDHGGLIGWTSGKTTIENVIMEGTVCSGESGGGFIGYIVNAEANITNSIMRGEVSAQNNCGGFIGNSGENTVFNISNCKNYGSVTGDKYVGGIVGRATGNTVTITNSTNEGKITANNDFIGGIIGGIEGINSSKFENCTNSGTITGKTWYIGGIVGASNNDGNITFNNCKNTVSISSPTNNYVGGIVGYAKGKTMMNNCVNTGNISGAQYTAGLCAWIQDDGCEITNCLNTGTVSTNGQSNGAGILSTVESQANNPTWKITNCVNTGDIKNGVSAIGGILGYMGNLDGPGTVIISDCINKGNIAVSGNDVGGIVGNLYSHGSSTQHHKYINCYNYGNIFSNSGSTDGVFVGGIVGREYGFAEFNGCRNYGTVNASSTSANSISGGICGWIEDDTSSFADCINYGNVTAKNNIGGILGEVSNAYNGTTFSFTKCGNYGNLSATTNNFADMGGIVGKLNARESTVKIYMSKCFNGNGKDGRIASVSYKAKNAGGLFGEVNQQAVIADSYNNASSISSGTNAGGLIGTNNGNTTLAYNSFSVTASVSKLVGSGGVTQYGCFTNTMGKGTAALATLNTTRTVSGISSVGNAYDYKQGVNNDYPALKWQLNTLTKNVGRNLIADLIADTAKSGYRAQGLPYDIKLDGVTKTYYPTYTKTENGVTVTYNTMSDLFTLSGTPTATGTIEILSGTNPEAKNVYFSAYYVGGNAMGCSATVYTSTISRTSSTHALKALSTGERVEIFATVNPNVPVQFDNYKFHASMDYVNNVTATSGALIDLHSTCSGLGTPTKEGYKFLGWYTVRAKGDAITDGSTAVSLGTPSFDDTLDRDVDIYAHWDPISYTVRYNGNGSTGGSTGNSVHIYDEAKNLTANGFKREFDVTFDYNYSGSTSTTATATSEFLGWATSENGNKVYEDKQSVKNLTAEDGKIIDLYAKWADSSVELPTPTRTGYTFDGWYTSDGTKVSQTFTPTAATKLTAHWTPITYTVSYNGNGATSGETASSSHTYDVAKALTANGFKREFTVTFDYNYSGSTATTAAAVSNFNGWAKTETGAAEYSDGASVTNLSSTDGDTVILYAIWTDVAVKFPTPTREGYDFSGWFNEAGQKVEETTVISEDITLHAQWSIKSYTVTFKNGDDVLQESKWEYNTTPTYNGATPTKSKDDSYEYTFSGWTPEISAVKDDIAYYAQYSKTAHDYRCDILDGKQHQYVCNDCGYKKAPEKHKLVYVKTDNGYSYTCSECGYSYTTTAKAYAVEFSCDSYSAANNAYIKSECEKYAAANPPVYNEAKSKNYYIATIKAPMTITENGQKMYFVYWLDAETGENVGTYTTYRYFQTKSSKFTPVYATQQEYYAMRNQAVIASRVVDCRLNDNGSYSLLAEHSVASSCESIKGHGVIYTTEAANAGMLTTDNDNVEKKAALKSANALTGLLEVSVDLHGANTVWARTYVIDANNEVHYGTVRQFDVTAGTSSAGDEIITLGAESYDLTDLNSDAEAPTIEDEPTEKSPLEILKTVFSKLIGIINEIISYFTKPGAKK